jgi:opacity protein-like surface antigen
MARRLTLVLAALYCFAVPAGALAAMDGLMAGAAITFGDDSGIGISARGEYPLESSLVSNVSIAGSLNLSFPSDPIQSWWQVSADALYNFGVNEMFRPYAGAGLKFASWQKKNSAPNYDFSSSSYDESISDFSVALDGIGGCKFDFDIGFLPFVEARIGVGGGNNFEMMVGVLYVF